MREAEEEEKGGEKLHEKGTAGYVERGFQEDRAGGR